jgi:hypothetical protein
LSQVPFRSRRVTIGAVIAAATMAVAGLWIAGRPAAGQGPSAAGFPAYQAPRTADGQPDLNGVWQSLTSANWDILEHEAQAGPYPALMAAYGAGPGGLGIVEGNELPYQPWALAKKNANLENRMKVDIVSDNRKRYDTGDPELACYLPGVPRATYMPFPFQILQSKDEILIIYEFKKAVRTVYLTDEYPEGPGQTWMGWSNGRWDGESLVVDVTGFNEYTWFDRAGNFHSDALHVVERYTPLSPHHMMYEATIDDPKVFTRPWKMRFPLYRRVEQHAQLMDFNCVEFAEEMLYGPLLEQADR